MYIVIVRTGDCTNKYYYTTNKKMAIDYCKHMNEHQFDLIATYIKAEEL